jgi:hypothetical protein
MLLCDGLDECAHVKDYIQQYLAHDLTKQAARVVISSRLAGFTDQVCWLVQRAPHVNRHPPAHTGFCTADPSNPVRAGP